MRHLPSCRQNRVFVCKTSAFVRIFPVFPSFHGAGGVTAPSPRTGLLACADINTYLCAVLSLSAVILSAVCRQPSAWPLPGILGAVSFPAFYKGTRHGSAVWTYPPSLHRRPSGSLEVLCLHPFCGIDRQDDCFRGQAG